MIYTLSSIYLTLQLLSKWQIHEWYHDYYSIIINHCSVCKSRNNFSKIFHCFLKTLSVAPGTKIQKYLQVVLNKHKYAAKSRSWFIPPLHFFTHRETSTLLLLAGCLSGGGCGIGPDYRTSFHLALRDREAPPQAYMQYYICSLPCCLGGEAVQTEGRRHLRPHYRDVH